MVLRQWVGKLVPGNGFSWSMPGATVPGGRWWPIASANRSTNAYSNSDTAYTSATCSYAEPYADDPSYAKPTNTSSCAQSTSFSIGATTCECAESGGLSVSQVAADCN